MLSTCHSWWQMFKRQSWLKLGICSNVLFQNNPFYCNIHLNLCFWVLKWLLLGCSIQTAAMSFRARKGPLSTFFSKFLCHNGQRDSIQSFPHQTSALSCSWSLKKLAWQDFKQASALPSSRQPSYLQTLSHIRLSVRNVGQITTSRTCENFFREPSCWSVFCRQRVGVSSTIPLFFSL